MNTLRDSGVSVIGKVPWGTHLCQFYESEEDLLDILVPYFKAGLENNEYCMWVTSEPVNEEDARMAMRKAMPDFDKYVKKEQIEIIPYKDWYLKGGSFDMKRVLNGWVARLDNAMEKGYSGIRITGNTAWLEKNDWDEFTDYEEEINNVIGRYNMIAICTYKLDRCTASDIIDVVVNHQFALIKRSGKWELIENYKKEKAQQK